MKNSGVAYKLGNWTVKPDSNELFRADEKVKIEARVMELLVFFCENPNRVISREELTSSVWGRMAIGENSINVAVASIRQALDDNARSPQFIETLPKRGYRMLMEPEILNTSIPAPIFFLKKHLVKTLAIMAVLFFGLWLFQKPQTIYPLREVILMLEAIQNETGEEENDIVVSNMGDILIAELAQNPSISVKKDLSNKFLGILPDNFGGTVVPSIISGKLLKDGENLQLSLQLRGPDAPEILWAKNEAIISDEFLPTAKSISEDLWAKLDIAKPENQSQTADQRRVEELYNMALQLSNHRSYVTGKLAHQNLQKAIKLDPTHAPSHELLAYLYTNGNSARHFGLEGDIRKIAIRQIELARKLGGNQAQLLASEGFLSIMNGDYGLAKSKFDKASEIAPDDLIIRRDRIWIDMAFGDINAALENNAMAANGAPDPTSILAERIAPLYYDGQIQQASDIYEATLELDLLPVYQGPYSSILLGEQEKGFLRWVEFIEYHDIEIGDVSEPLNWVKNGHFTKAYNWLREQAGVYAQRRSWPLTSASWHLISGDKEKAISEIYEAAVKFWGDGQQTASLIWVYLPLDPYFKELHDDPRFQEVINLVSSHKAAQS